MPVSIAVGERVIARRRVDERADPGPGGHVVLGVFELPAGRDTSVTILTDGTDGHLIADTVAFVRLDD